MTECSDRTADQAPPAAEAPRSDEVAPSDGTPRSDEGGDAACWAHRVCQECGRLNGAERPLVCEACGTPFD
ncbi:MAG: hypothetical protein ACRDNS_12300 [Trebonia sp.]